MNEKLTDLEKRVLIAEDVLACLSMDVYMPRSVFFVVKSGPLKQSWTLLDQEKFKQLSGSDVQKAVQELEYCEVCAIGAAFVSGIRLFDGIDGSTWDIRKGFNSQGAQTFFPQEDLNCMEKWFEATSSVEGVWKLGYNQRMKVVFESIRDNGGKVLSSDIEARVKALIVAANPA